MANFAYVNHVIHTVKFVIARQIMIALLVNQITISNLNLITRLVLIAAQQHTTSRIATGHVNHVIHTVKFVIARQLMIVLLVNQITISNLITRLVLIAAQHHTTPIVTAKNVSHVMKPVKFVLTRQIIALLVIRPFICNMTL